MGTDNDLIGLVLARLAEEEQTADLFHEAPFPHAAGCCRDCLVAASWP